MKRFVSLLIAFYFLYHASALSNLIDYVVNRKQNIEICVFLCSISDIACYYDSHAASYASPLLPDALIAANCTHYIYIGIGLTVKGEIRFLNESFDATSKDLRNDADNFRLIKNIFHFRWFLVFPIPAHSRSETIDPAWGNL